MLREWLAGRRSVIATGASFVVIGAVVATAAVASTGYTAQRLDLDDGAVWVVNAGERAIGRANPAVLELNTVVHTGSASSRVVQSGSTALVVDPANATLDLVDPAEAELGERVPLPPEQAEVHVAADHAVIHATGTGQVWIVPVIDLDDFDPAAPESLALAEDAELSLADDGTLVAVAPSLGEVYRLDVTRTDQVEQRWSIPPDSAGGDYQITSVGGNWAVLDPSERRLVTEAGTVDLTGIVGSGGGLALQRPSSGGGDVLIGFRDGLVAAPLGGGDPRLRADVGGGAPAAPVVADGCRYAAWAAGTAWRECAGEPVTLALARMPGNAELAFARSGRAVVLNDARGGGSWAVQQGGELIDNWEELIVPDDDLETPVLDDELPPELDDEQRPPVAVDDEFGARPGRATVLPVLLNDYDPNADVLVVSDVEPVDESVGRIDLVSRGQQLQLTLEPEATGGFDLRYTITDGRGGSASAIVSVAIRTPDQNAPPQQVRQSRAEVAAGSRVTTHVLGDWIDPDGDPFYLTAAATAEPGSASHEPGGRVVFSSAVDGPEAATVGLAMSDGRSQASGTLEVEILPPGEVPIVVDPWIVLAAAGEEVTVRPLDHVRGGSGTIRLNAVPEKPGIAVSPSFEAGTFVVSSDRVGTHYVSFTVTDGDLTANGLVRIDVTPPPDAGTRPITVPQTMFVRTLESAVVDPTATDIDPAGGVLVVTGVTDVPAGSGIRAEVLDQRQVRVTLGAPLEGGLASLHYRISNGVADAEGTITVVEIPEPTRIQAPIAVDDTATVRVGDVADIPVLANDEHPDGKELELLPELSQDLPPDAGLLFGSGDRLRYLAPDVAGNYSAVYSVRAEDGQLAQATVRISVREADPASNAPPVAAPVTARVIAGETTRIEVPLHGIDPDGDAVQLIGVASNPEKGTAQLVEGSTIEYEAGDYSSGTDTFRYTIVDGLGARAEGVIRVGISPRLDGARNPVANEDIVSIRPGRTVSVQVLANDSDPDGSPLRVISGAANAEGTEVEVVDDLFLRITPPEEPGQYSVVYTIANEFGGTSQNFVTVTVDPDAPLAMPIARDFVLSVSDVLDRQSVDVDVLSRVFFADGDVGELGLSLVPRFASSAELLPDKRIRVTIGGASQIIPFSVSHPEDPGVRGYAFLWVPGYDDALPQLDRTAPPLEVSSEDRLLIELNDHVVALGDETVQLVDPGSVTATHSDGGDLVVDEDTLSFTSADRYFGPASITFEVTDGGGPDDLDGRRALLTLPITVHPRENQPPLFIGADVNFEPGESKELDLVRLTDYPYDDVDELEYRILEPRPAGFDVALNGQRLVVTAERGTPKGTTAVVRLGVRDAVNEGEAGNVRLTVVPSTRPLAKPVPDRDVTRRGATTVVDVLSNDQVNNPFPESPLSVVAIRGIDGASLPDGVSVRPSADRSRLTVTVSPSAAAIDTNLQYQVADVTGDPDRYVWGTATISVQDVPDPVTNLRVTEFGDRSLRLAWSAGAANNSPIDRYEVTMTSASSGSVLSTTSCTTTVGCAVTTPGNGPEHAVRLSVVAINEIGPSTPVTDPSGAIWSDIIPPPPSGVTWEARDQGLRIHWTKPAATGTASPIERYVVTVGGETRTLNADPADSVGTPYTLTIERIPSLKNGSAVGFSVSARNSAPNTLAVWNSAGGTGIPAWTPLVVGSPTASGLAAADGTVVTAGWGGAFAANGRAISEYRAAIYAHGTAPACDAATPYGTATSATFDGLSPNVAYTVVVYASNGLGGCSQAATTTVTPRAVPGTATGITAGGAVPSGEGRWDFTIERVTAPNGPVDHLRYRLVGSGVDGSASGMVPLGRIVATGNGSHYGVSVSVEVKACKEWPEVTLCSANWSPPFPLGTPVRIDAPSGLTATVVDDGVLGGEGRWDWSAPPPGAYEAIEYDCGDGWQAFPAGASSCEVRRGILGGWPDLKVRVTANGGAFYERSFEWQQRSTAATTRGPEQ